MKVHGTLAFALMLLIVGPDRGVCRTDRKIEDLLLDAALVVKDRASGQERMLARPQLELVAGRSVTVSSFAHHMRRRPDGTVESSPRVRSFVVAFTPQRFTKYGWLFQVETFAGDARSPDKRSTALLGPRTSRWLVKSAPTGDYYADLRLRRRSEVVDSKSSVKP